MTQPVFQRMAVVGCGLIGSSVIRAAREAGAVAQVAVADTNAHHRDRIQALGIADLVTAEELARRAAAAVDNARLFAEAEQRADAARVLEHIGDGVFMLDGEVVEHAPTNDIFQNPSDERTERYVTGKFG